ncbi:MAG: tetratricopeptide repeat protein, partial [Candidatus Omnitrophica bacterium]|nr:tetratricopeptide repeat protein [Candidatus Omnitrophota bacterium]
LAIKEFREAIKLDPKFADAYNYLGYMFAEEGVNLDEAVSLIKKALEYDPANGAYLDSLGWAYFRKGMTDEALVEMEKSVKIEPDDATIRDHMGDVYFKKGLVDKARLEWQRSLDLDPDQENVKEKLEKIK